MPCLEQSVRVWRVSSARISSASFSTRKARRVMSSKHPIGVATIDKRPAMSARYHICEAPRSLVGLVDLDHRLAELVAQKLLELLQEPLFDLPHTLSAHAKLIAERLQGLWVLGD